MKQKGLIAIISYNIHSQHMNYGAALHSWAFQHYLSKYGCKSIIIDYIPKILENYNIKFPILNNKHFWHIRTTIHNLINWGCGFYSNMRKYRKFQCFFQVYTNKTEDSYSYKQLTTLDSIEHLNFDKFVAESDVIWKLYEIGGFDSVFFLDIPAAKNKIKIAYSPSLGSRLFNNEEEVRFKWLVKDFQAISTREKQCAEYLGTLLGIRIEWTLDPVLLLDENEYSPITSSPKERGYVLLYNCMVNDIEMVREAEKYAKQKGKLLIEICNWYENKMRFHHKVVTDCGIEEFLGYFKYADCVISNAFHGFCFSIVYKKEVFLFQRDESDFRMKNITDALGLSARLIPYNRKSLPIAPKSIDFKEVYRKLSIHRERSRIFIETHIVN